MLYKDAKKKKVGDWVGCQGYDENGIIIDISHSTSTKELLFKIMFETYGTVMVNHKKLSNRILCSCGGVLGYRDFENALYCPSVIKHNLTETSNEDLFKLWGVSNPLT